MHVHVLRTFECVSAQSAASQPPFVEAKEAAGAAQTRVNLGKTCTCMHILRATSDPQGHHERAKRTGGQAFLCFYDNKKDAQRPYDHFAGGIAPRSLLCVRKQRFLFYH